MLMPTPQISQRARNTIESPMRKYAPLLRAAEADGVEIIKLHIGDPDLPVPKVLLKTIASYHKKTLPYAPSTGLPEHVAAWVKYYRRFGVRLEAADIIPTEGGAEAIQMALLAVADPGDEILIFEPLYSGFRSSAGMYNIKLVPVPLRIKDGFRLPDESELLSRITPRTKAIVVINPDNPTGKLWTAAELKRILAIAESRGLFVISDETYREIVFRGKPACLLSLPEADERVIVIDSLSKRFSAPGARIGAVVSRNREVMKAALKFAMARLAVATLEQIGFIPLLSDAKRYTDRIVAEYRGRRDALIAELKKLPGVTCHTPGGAFYVVVRLPVADADDFVRFLLTKFRHRGVTVMVTPIAAFYMSEGAGRDEIRIACVREAKVLRRAARLLGLALGQYRKANDQL